MNKHAKATVGTFSLLIDGLVLTAFLVGLIWYAAQVSTPQAQTVRESGELAVVSR